MKNYIGLNISRLVKRENLSKEAFGRMFELKRGAISSYIDGKALPKIETLQKISAYYKLSIDDIINGNIETLKKVGKTEILLSGEEKPVSGIEKIQECEKCEALKEKIDFLEQLNKAKDDTIKAYQSKSDDANGNSKRTSA